MLENQEGNLLELKRVLTVLAEKVKQFSEVSSVCLAMFRLPPAEEHRTLLGSSALVNALDPFPFCANKA